VKSERLVHDMKDLCKQMDQKIEKLEAFRDVLKARLSDNIAVKKNTKELTRVMVSLVHSKVARRAMEDSCCEYGCVFEPHDR
jgi:phage shock protein A